MKNWFLAIRPKTLPAAIAPVFIGTAMAFGDGVGHGLSALFALIGAVAVQIGTNLANDYYDFQKGADTHDRLGPVRVTQAGLIKPQTVRTGFIFSFLIASLASLYLISRGGWPIATIGILAIISGILYTAGPYPLGYIGLGDIFVFIFFGPVAVGGTYYVQSFEINAAVILAGCAPGLLSAAILTINNLRDHKTDQAAGKQTLVVRFGRHWGLSEFLFCVLGASIIPVLIFGMTRDYLPSLAAVSISLFAIPVIKTVLTKTDGPSLNSALAMTGRLLFLYSILFSIGWIAL